jgi:peroxiredoxin
MHTKRAGHAVYSHPWEYFGDLERYATIAPAHFIGGPVDFVPGLMHRILIGTLVFGLLSSAHSLIGQPASGAPRTKIDVSRLGPQVGQTVPDFSLTDQNGKVWTRASIMGPKGGLLLFYRSADWCPYCKTQLMDLQSRLGELRAKGLGVAAISYDPVPTLAEFATRQQITFPLLSDAGSATIKAFGILNPMPEMAFGPDKDEPDVVAQLQKYVSGGRTSPSWVGIAFPGTFILDPQGRVVSRFFEDYYVERTTFSNIMLRLGNGTTPVEATRIAGNHLDLTAYASDTSVAAGNRFSVAIDVQPHAGVHVYAPGASGYRVIGLTIRPQPYLRVLPATYPKSEIYVFKPLNERVPVFQKPFTLVQELVLEGTRGAQAAFRGKESLAVEGSLEYQACDDTVCFNPVSVPLTWTLNLKPLVTERAPRTQP